MCFFIVSCYNFLLLSAKTFFALKPYQSRSGLLHNTKENLILDSIFIL